MHATFAYAKLPVQDYDRAKEFYEQKLGLVPFGEDHGHAYYEAAGVRFMLFASTGVPSGTHDQLGFVVDDLDTSVKELRAAGVAFEDNQLTRDGIAELGRVRAAWFKDSEGNLLNLIEGDSPLWT